MSTKTTFKRVALVTVAALGFGVLTSVAPASANGQQEIVSSIAAGTPAPARSGVTSSTPITLNLPSTAASTDTIVVGVRLLTAPATSTLASVTANPTQSAYTGATNLYSGSNGSTAVAANLDIVASSTGSGSYGSITAATGRYVSTSGNATSVIQYIIGADDSPGQIVLKVNFKPDVSGTYTFLVSTPTSVSASSVVSGYTPSASDLSTTFTITTSGAATTATITAVTGAASSGSGVYGQLYALTLKDSAGAATLLSSTDSLNLTSSDSSISFSTTNTSTAPDATATTKVVARDTTGWSGNTFYFRVDNSSTTSESATITATGNGTLSSAVTTSVGISFTAATETAVAATVGLTTTEESLVTTTTTAGITCAAIVSPNKCYATSPADSSHTLRATIGTIAAFKTYWTVTDVSGKITGMPGAKYTVPVTFAAADTVAYKDTTITAALAVTDSTTQYFTAVLNALAPATVHVKAVVAATTSIDVTNDNRRVAAASTNTFVATLTDQYGAAMSNKTITVTVAGRNGTTASSSLVTNASGEVSYSLTDAGTVGTTDAITFTYDGVTGSAALTYGTTTVTTLDILGPNDSAANTPDTNVTFSDKKGINAAKGGATGTTAAVTVTAKDANGVLMSGVPVTFSVAGTTAALLDTLKVVYTAADGTASTSVYAWTTGSYVVTAVAGGKTSTTTAYFAQKDPTYARTIAAAVSGNVVTATVKDRYGNVVKDVYVYATRTGTGYFGSGSASTSGQTNEAGQVEFFVTGSASVTVSLGGASAADANYGQSGSALGFIKQGDGATPAAVTAYVAGDAVTDAVGVGAAFAAAGINSATVSVEAGVTAAETAADAAAEATDAANAATDAANAAAEAADAATAAAQDAADAVAALSAQVATLISGLKAQLTALTNLVIKIQKKVKA